MTKKTISYKRRIKYKAFIHNAKYITCISITRRSISRRRAMRKVFLCNTSKIHYILAAVKEIMANNKDRVRPVPITGRRIAIRYRRLAAGSTRPASWPYNRPVRKITVVNKEIS